MVRSWSWRLRHFTGSLLVQGEQVAGIRSRMVPTKLARATGVRQTDVAFTDGARWSIVTGPPQEPPAPQPESGRRKRKRHSAGDRVAVVTDERQRVLAFATWPDRKTQRAKMIESMGDHKAWSDTTETVVSAAKSTSNEIRRRRPHRRGRAKWLVLALVLFFMAFGWMPAAIALLIEGDTGLGVGFAVAFLASLLFGLLSLRRWRDVSTCWSCGQAITESPPSCPYCGAVKPRSAGFAQRFLSTSTSGAFTRVVLGGALRRVGSSLLRANTEAPQVSVGEETLWMLPDEDGSRSRLGDILTISTGVKATSLIPTRSVPLEAALLCWHIAIGDVQYPTPASGGG